MICSRRVLFSAMFVLAGTLFVFAQEEPEDLTNRLQPSCIFLSIAEHGYSQSQPWKFDDVFSHDGCGIAVGENTVLTTAWNVRDVSDIKARRFGQNEFIPARVKCIDYDSNLCLLELDRQILGRPLKSVRFSKAYRKGAAVTTYWLSESSQIYSGRGFLDEAAVSRSITSYHDMLTFSVSNVSKPSGAGQIYCLGAEPIGIACLSDSDKNQVRLIPGEVIERFLFDVADDKFVGIGAMGFEYDELLDPARRAYLKMPENLTHGCIIREVHNLGTGSDVLKRSDVLLSMEGFEINPYGRFRHPIYDRLFLDYLITSRSAGDILTFEVWRDGEKKRMLVDVKPIITGEMLIPYYNYDRRPQYMVVGGIVLQQLTRPYLTQWGVNWSGKVDPLMLRYLDEQAFKPTDARRDVIILSYVLPHDINLGYQDIYQKILKTYNGREIRSMADLLAARQDNPDSPFEIMEFEMANPTIVLPRAQLPAADQQIQQRYGVRELQYIEKQ